MSVSLFIIRAMVFELTFDYSHFSAIQVWSCSYNTVVWRWFYRLFLFFPSLIDLLKQVNFKWSWIHGRNVQDKMRFSLWLITTFSEKETFSPGRKPRVTYLIKYTFISCTRMLGKPLLLHKYGFSRTLVTEIRYIGSIKILTFCLNFKKCSEFSKALLNDPGRCE